MSEIKVKAIPKEKLKAAIRRLRRSFAAAIVGAMADTDTSFTVMAARLGEREKTVKRWLMRLADGRKASSGDSFRQIANMATACNCRLDFKLVPREASGLHDDRSAADEQKAVR